MHNSLKGTGCPGRTKAQAPRGLAVKGKAVSLLVESAGQGAGLLSLPRGSAGVAQGTGHSQWLSEHPPLTC